MGGTLSIKFFWRYNLWVWDEDALRTFFWGTFFDKKIEKFSEDLGFLMQIPLIFLFLGEIFINFLILKNWGKTSSLPTNQIVDSHPL
jgi:hypothetical protein